MKNPDANRSSQHEIPNQIVFEWLWK
jgi:hypothetical protein